MSDILDPAEIGQTEQIRKTLKLAEDNALLRRLAIQARDQFANTCLQMFNVVWMRPTAADIQEFLDTFSPEEQQQMFSRHAAAMQYLSALPGFVPQVPPYAFTWSETGAIVIGEKLA